MIYMVIESYAFGMSFRMIKAFEFKAAAEKFAKAEQFKLAEDNQPDFDEYGQKTSGNYFRVVEIEYIKNTLD